MTTSNLLFSDYFCVPKEALAEHGAFDISLVTDLPLFVDPFLLFNSEKSEYQELHDEIITYLQFLRDKAMAMPAAIESQLDLYRFREVKQNWLGFSKSGNRGRG